MANGSKALVAAPTKIIVRKSKVADAVGNIAVPAVAGVGAFAVGYLVAEKADLNKKWVGAGTAALGTVGAMATKGGIQKASIGMAIGGAVLAVSDWVAGSSAPDEADKSANAAPDEERMRADMMRRMEARLEEQLAARARAGDFDAALAGRRAS